MSALPPALLMRMPVTNSAACTRAVASVLRMRRLISLPGMPAKVSGLGSSIVIAISVAPVCSLANEPSFSATRPPVVVNRKVRRLNVIGTCYCNCCKRRCEEESMIRERALKIVMVLVGLLFSAAIYPVIGGLRNPANSDTGDTMMMGLYFTLGIFLLIGVRNPTAHRSLIAFTAWSSFAHAAVMSALGFEMPSERTGFLAGSAVLVVIGVVLIALAPARQSAGQASASGG